MPQRSALHCPYWAPGWVPELCTHKRLKCPRLSRVHSMIFRMQHSLWFPPFQEADVAVTSYLYLALRPTCVLPPLCPLQGYPQKSVSAAERGIGSIPAVFEVLLLSTSQPPEWTFPSLWLGRGVEQDGGRGYLQTRIGTHKFPVSLSLFSATSKMWSVWCDAAPFFAGKTVPLLTSTLLSSLSNQLHIIHICQEIWSQLRETNDFC